MSTLAIEEVTVTFGGLTAVSDATLVVPDGELVGLIGPNGAGKTTLFNVVSGFIVPDAGSVAFDGRDITREPPAARARMGVGRTFQRLELFGRMSVFENLMVASEAAHSTLDMGSDLLGLPRRRHDERRCAAVVERIGEMLGLLDVFDRRASDLPVGRARIVELARALCTEPRLLLLDEPSSGLDTAETRAFGELLLRINRDEGIGMLLVEHDLDLVMDVCSDIYVLDFGRTIAHGAYEDVMKDAAVRTAYLGEEDDAAPATAPRR